MYTHHNNALRLQDVGQEVKLKGFVAKKRDLGTLVFIDLRDQEGITQLAFDEQNDLRSITTGIKHEFVLEVRGVVRERSSKNPDLPTGDIEIDVTQLEVLAQAKTPPLLIQDDTDALEETRLTYRYLDLRRPYLQKMFRLRHDITQAVRSFLNGENFMEFETPILTKSTPEGARDYVVPSRLHEGHFYALPQSPQLFKQLLMISGFEKYYQIAKCFRDEDLRSDRQPEFTQIDIEMSFIDQEAVLDLSERMIKHVMKTIKGLTFEEPFPRLPYHEAMRRFGSDKPDTRFGLELVNVNDVFEQTSFSVFKTVLEASGNLEAITVKGGATQLSRKDLDGFGDIAKRYGAKGLAYLKWEDALAGPLAKFVSDEERDALNQVTGFEQGDILLVVADQPSIAYDAMGHIRLALGKKLDLIDETVFDFTWIVDWPMFEYDATEGRHYALHHPFTRVQSQDMARLKDEPTCVLANAYDLVVQGQELGGGSLRIHEPLLQASVFEILGLSEAEQEAKFGFLKDALTYGAPPHGGIAFGLDRLVMLLGGTKNIRDVILFPKTTSAQCLMTEAPSALDEATLKALKLQK